MLGCLSWASFTILLRYWRVPAMTATTALAIYPAFLYLPVWWLFLPSQMAEAPAGAIAFQALYHGIIAVAVAGFLFARAVTAIGPARTTTVTAITPALAALLAWPLLGSRWAGLASPAWPWSRPAWCWGWRGAEAPPVPAPADPV
ncbi:EamA family transporter [Pseudoroseomonas wenyumeiae]